MSKRVFGLLLAFALILSLQPAALAQQTAASPATAPGRDPRAKIHPNLMREIEAQLGAGARLNAGRQSIQFMARIQAGTDLSRYAERWFTRPFRDPTGSTVAIGFARAGNLLKMATLDGVLMLQRPESLVEAPKPVDDDLASLNRAAAPKLALQAKKPAPQPQGWYDTRTQLHGSQAAWAKGYTGTGVRYMSNDSGADYCHPDLRNTWAYIDDPASPYYGLPQMFDSYSSYVAARDFYLDESNIAAGLADYADTSTEVSGAVASYRPLGAAAAHSYTLPGTSVSGVYHIGSHPDKGLADVAAIINGAFGDGTAVTGERAAVLVVDVREAGVYDAVYVDLNYNFDFRDDIPALLNRGQAPKSSPTPNKEAACLDYNGDGLNDISGGLVYFIADGTTALPTLDWFWGIPGETYGNGDLVAFHVQDFTEGGGNHGQGTTSSAVGQGVVRGNLANGPNGPPWAGGRGLVVGPGRDVWSTQNGDWYLTPFIEDGYIYAGFGYDGETGTGDEVQIVSNSWGFSDVDTDGLDYYSRLIDVINRVFAPNTALLFSTGNGAAGYGTNAPPTPPTSIAVGASTIFNETGDFEEIASVRQMVGGDVMSWSNRGPRFLPGTGADVVASGAFGAGDLSLNEVLDGSIATYGFGGTSQSAPIAAGNLALIYQAWRDRTGSWPTFAEAKQLLMGTAKDTYHDVFSQGAGLVDADAGTDVAGGLAGVAPSPADWTVGEYRGTSREGFPNIVYPGKNRVQTFTLSNYSDRAVTVKLDSTRFAKISTRTYSFTTLDQSLDHGTFTVPDYVFRVDQDIPADTDLMMVRVTRPYEQFDPDDDQLEPFSNWDVNVYNWTDLNGDGQYWKDADGNGKVSISLDDEGNLVGSEMDAREYVRFTYGYNRGPTQQARVAQPLDRKATGILIGFRHRNRIESVPTTDLTVEVSYWRQKNWQWLSLNRDTLEIPAQGTASFRAFFNVPPETRPGFYEGAITATYLSGRLSDHRITIPVVAAVASRGTSFEFGRKSDGLLYDNGLLFGYTDYSWRAESGDTRFFWTDIAASDLPKKGTPYLVVDNSWKSDGTDIDTTVVGPSPDCFSNGVGCPGLLEGFPGFDAIYGPYGLAELGRSENTYIGSGRWRFQTSSGGPREIIAAPAQEGLHGLILHQVKVDGGTLDEPFSGNTGLVTLDPSALTGVGGASSATIRVSSQIKLSGLTYAGFGLSKPISSTETIQQDDPTDPSTASFVTTFNVTRGGRLTVRTGGSEGNDIDLYVFDPSGALVGSSLTPADEESVSVRFPEDGAYTILVHGYGVPAGTDTFELTIDAIQGSDVSASSSASSISAGGTGEIQVTWDTSGKEPGTYSGLLVFGPEAAPGLFELPIEVTVP